MCNCVLSDISGCGGWTVTGPSQFPARPFIASKDFCASGGATWSAALCASCCAKATVVRDIKATNSIRQMDFMFFLLKFLYSPPGGFRRRTHVGEKLRCDVLL